MDISSAEATVKKMRSYISAFRELGAQQHWVDRMGLSYKDAIASLGQFVEQAKRDRNGVARAGIDSPMY
jgi:hypothetical protein